MEVNPYEAPLEPADQIIFRDASRMEMLVLPICRQLVRALYGVAPALLLIVAYVILFFVARVFD